MTVQRDVAPLPVGVYWVDLQDTKVPSFNAWTTINVGRVRVLKTVEDRPGVATQIGRLTWFLFEVLQPTDFPEPLGFPNIAERGAETDLDDVIQQPPPEKDIIDILPTGEDIQKGFTTAAVIVGAAVLVAILARRR